MEGRLVSGVVTPPSASPVLPIRPCASGKLVEETKHVRQRVDRMRPSIDNDYVRIQNFGGAAQVGREKMLEADLFERQTF